MNNRHRRVARLQAKEDARILGWGWWQAFKRQYGSPNVEMMVRKTGIGLEKANEAMAQWSESMAHWGRIRRK